MSGWRRLCPPNRAANNARTRATACVLWPTYAFMHAMCEWSARAGVVVQQRSIGGHNIILRIILHPGRTSASGTRGTVTRRVLKPVGTMGQRSRRRMSRPCPPTRSICGGIPCRVSAGWRARPAARGGGAAGRTWRGTNRARAAPHHRPAASFFIPTATNVRAALDPCVGYRAASKEL
jgi:hypothetical protein